MTRKENMNDSLKALSRRVDESEMDGDAEIKRKEKEKEQRKEQDKLVTGGRGTQKSYLPPPMNIQIVNIRLGLKHETLPICVLVFWQ